MFRWAWYAELFYDGSSTENAAAVEYALTSVPAGLYPPRIVLRRK
jgi:hypothetical protein